MNLLKAVLCFPYTLFPLNFHRVQFHSTPNHFRDLVYGGFKVQETLLGSAASLSCLLHQDKLSGLH